MGYLQVAAEIEEKAPSGADRDTAVREFLLRDFTTPFKKVPYDWIQPGLTYLKVRI